MCVREKEQTHTCINAKAYYNSQAQTRISIHKPFNGLQNAAKGRMKDGQSGNEIETAPQKGCYLNTASQISESDYTPNSRSKLNQQSSFCHFKRHSHAKTWTELKRKYPRRYARGHIRASGGFGCETAAEGRLQIRSYIKRDDPKTVNFGHQTTSFAQKQTQRNNICVGQITGDGSSPGSICRARLADNQSSVVPHQWTRVGLASLIYPTQTSMRRERFRRNSRKCRTKCLDKAFAQTDSTYVKSVLLFSI